MGKLTEQEILHENCERQREDYFDSTMQPIPAQEFTRKVQTHDNELAEEIPTDNMLPSPGGNSTASNSSSNHSNLYTSSDAQSVSSSSDLVEPSKLDAETHKAQIRYQVEFYFSPQNLQRDTYMQSKMDIEGYVPLTTIAEFKQIKRLSATPEAIAEAIESSSICALSSDKRKIKAAWKRPERTTIIVREVEEQTTDEDIRRLFDGTEFVICSVRKDVAQTWFIMLKSEAEAKNALLHLIGKTLHGQRIKARLKSETLPAPTPIPPSFQSSEKLNFISSQQQQQLFPTYPFSQQNMGFNMVGYPGANTWDPNLAYQGTDRTIATSPRNSATPEPIMNLPQEMRHVDMSAGMLYSQDMLNLSKYGRQQRTFGIEGLGRRRPGPSMYGHNKHSSSMTGRKKKSSYPRRTRSPVFKANDFPSLPATKINTTGSDISDSESPCKSEVDPEKAVNKTNMANTSQGSGASWAETVAKAKVNSPTAAQMLSEHEKGTTITSKPKLIKSPRNEHIQSLDNRQPDLRKKESVKHNSVDSHLVKQDGIPSTETYKDDRKYSKGQMDSKDLNQQGNRGWEKPSLATQVHHEKPEVIRTDKPHPNNLGPPKIDETRDESSRLKLSSTNSVDKQTPNGERVNKAWGAKKSFAEVIKSGVDSKSAKMAFTASENSIDRPDSSVRSIARKHSVSKGNAVSVEKTHSDEHTGINGDWRKRAPSNSKRISSKGVSNSE